MKDRTNMNSATEQELAFAKRVARFVGVYFPLVLTLAATILLIVWMDRMPDPMATHWSGGDGPDGYGPAWSNLALSLGTGIGITALFALIPFFDRRRSKSVAWGWTNRFMAAMALWTVSFMQVLAVLTSYVQLDLDDATQAPGVGAIVLIGLVVATLLGILGWFVQPNLTVHAPTSEITNPIKLAPSARAAWFGTTSMPKPLAFALVATTLALPIVLLVEFASPDRDTTTIVVLAICSILSLGLIATVLSFRVRIDKHGVEVRSVLGWPVFRVPADDVIGVEVREIHAFSEYGGWGIRLAGDRFGIVLRNSEGFIITRKSRSRTFAVTIDDARTAGSLLARMAENNNHSK